MSDAAGYDLKALFEPKSLVVVGASEKLGWMRSVKRNLDHFGFGGPVFAVNPRGVDVFGLPGFSSCAAIGQPLDAAIVMAPAAAMEPVMRDIAAAGVKAAVVVTSGFAEAGEHGRAHQDAVAEIARAHGVALFGPNSLGFVKVSAGVALCGMPLVTSVVPGRVGIVAQSGGIAAETMATAARYGLGLSFYANTGNEAVVTLADIIEYLVDDPATAVIAVCAESIRNPSRFMDAARRSHAAGKPLVILKVGVNALTAEVAQAHTGSMVGDDRVFDALCEALAIVRVPSIEDLVITASVMEAVGPLRRPGIGFVSISGGACTLIADAVGRYGVEVPAFSHETSAALREILPSYASTLNPLDITGGSTSNPGIFTQAIEIVASDPSVDLVVSVLEFPAAADPEAVTPLHRAVGVGHQALTSASLHLISTLRPMDAGFRAFLREAGIPRLTCGIEHSLRAFGRLAWWSARAPRPLAAPAPATGKRMHGLTSEHGVLSWLGGEGVAVAPAVLTGDRSAAVEAARRMGGPVVLKIASSDIQHKTDIGGVRLDIAGDDAVGEAYDAIVAAVGGARLDARLDGVLVAPMRKGGLELLVGVARDPQWGPVLAVGFGGIFAEVLKDTALRLLPVTPAEVAQMLGGLRGADLLRGARGGRPADLLKLSEQIAAIGAAALSLGPELAALEVNPLWVDGDRVEALDGLVVWRMQDAD